MIKMMLVLAKDFPGGHLTFKGFRQLDVNAFRPILGDTCSLIQFSGT